MQLTASRPSHRELLAQRGVVAEYKFDSYFDEAPSMAQLREQVMRVAPQDTSILLAGETGTGKTRLARLIHELSPRRAEPFLVVDCGALSPSLIESEMFGHVKGAFTGADRERAGKFAAAARGTLLLDEINSLPLPLQSKLLRVVEERVFEPVGSNRGQPVQARVIAASNAHLEQEVEAGRFRADLYYRLNVVGFYLPPLSSRRTSIVPMCQKFIAEFAASNRPDVQGIIPAALMMLQNYDWPGNIRELRNVIERAVALCRGPMVELADLPETIRVKVGATTEALEVPGLPRPPMNPACMTLTESKELAERQLIQGVLAKHKNNRLRAAAELGISRMGLYKKLHKYEMIKARAQACVPIAPTTHAEAEAALEGIMAEPAHPSQNLALNARVA
jgi:transcriptional regulator with PAS, ATPase and Fis domain